MSSLSTAPLLTFLFVILPHTYCGDVPKISYALCRSSIVMFSKFVILPSWSKCIASAIDGKPLVWSNSYACFAFVSCALVKIVFVVVVKTSLYWLQSATYIPALRLNTMSVSSKCIIKFFWGSYVTRYWSSTSERLSIFACVASLTYTRKSGSRYPVSLTENWCPPIPLILTVWSAGHTSLSKRGCTILIFLLGYQSTLHSSQTHVLSQHY